MTLETLNDYIFNLPVFIIIFIDDVTNMFNRLNQCRKTSPANANRLRQVSVGYNTGMGILFSQQVLLGKQIDIL